MTEKENTSDGVPSFEITATVAAVVGDIFFTACAFLGVPLLFAGGAGVAVILLGLGIRQLIASVLVLYSFTSMDGPDKLKQYIASTIETVLNPIGILFSPRTIMIIAWFAFFVPFGLTIGILLAWLMHVKILRFTGELIVGAGIEKFVSKGAGMAAKKIVESEAEAAVKRAATALPAGAQRLESMGASGLFVAEEGVGSEKWLEESMERSAARRREYQEGWKEGHETFGTEPTRTAEGKSAVSETAFGMPEGPFEAIEHEILPQDIAPQPQAAKVPEETVRTGSGMTRRFKHALKIEAEGHAIEKGLGEEEEDEEDVDHDLDLKKAA